MKKKNMKSWKPGIQKKGTTEHSIEKYYTTRNDDKGLAGPNRITPILRDYSRLLDN